MKSLRGSSGVWVLAVILGLTGASCAVHKGAVLIKDGELPHEQNRRVGTAHQESSTVKEPDAATQAKVQAAYGQLPLSFEANQGQSDKQVKFLSRGSGYTLFLTSSEAVLALRRGRGWGSRIREN